MGGSGLLKTSASPTTQAQTTPSGRQAVMLSAVDAHGRAQPGAFGREAAGTGLPDGGRKAKKVRSLGRTASLRGRMVHSANSSWMQACLVSTLQRA